MKTILVVDDNKCIRDVLALAFTDFLQDCAVMTAGNGAEGARIFDSSPVDVIITDLSMPLMDGYQLMEYVRARSSEIPLIVISAEFFPDHDKKTRPFRVARSFKKPFQLHDIVLEVASLLGLAEHVSHPEPEHGLAVSNKFSMTGHQYAPVGSHHS